MDKVATGMGIAVERKPVNDLADITLEVREGFAAHVSGGKMRWNIACSCISPQARRHDKRTRRREFMREFGENFEEVRIESSGAVRDQPLKGRE